MSVTVTDTTSTMAPPSDKKSKRDKGEKAEKSSKKRLREAQEAEAAEAEHQHKRAKSEVPTVADDGEASPAEKKKKKKDRKAKEDAPAAEEPAEEPVEASAKKDKKKKKKHADREPVPVEVPVADDVAPGISNENTQIDTEERKHKKEKKKDKTRKKEEPAVEPAAADAMDVDMIPDATAGGSFGKLPAKPFPFYTQTVSQYLALYPSGMVEPIEGYVDQHLTPLLNRYVPEFKGVLLGHRKVRVGEAPGKGSLTEESDMTDQALLESIDEYAVGFGWLTAEVDLFKPSRGALLEGVVNLQTEGHLGVVCWDMFNASIEAARLPEGWRWVSLLGKDKTTLPTPEPANEDEDEGEAGGEAEGEKAEAGDDVAQLHTTGYWVDENGDKVRTIQFRVKNYEVGHSGDYGFLSIEGTMLSEEDEKQKLADEIEWQRRRRLRHGGQLRREHKRLPAFSMTKFGGEDEEERVNPAETAQALSEALAVEE